ncbi:CG32547 [Drosophila busckii]|uniref:CG32547 n=2 Tax=Drosophila busckii TaxID=30019 RepID=A0A0M4EKL9_DROBS|nr:CG32547 [Drosophila busckii]
MDDMHEYTRGLFLLMYCGPAILLSYLYIRTSQELRPPDGPFAVMMYEHRADLRIRQRNSSTSSAEPRTHSGGGVAGLSNGNSTANRSYDLYSAELDVHRERRKQRNFGSMAATQVVCVCPLMILRFARFSLEETYENQKHFDFTYLMFVWIAFLPTVIFPCIYASQILPRDEQERLRGYFRLSSKRKTKARRSDAGTTSREDSIEKDEHTNTTSIAGHGPAQLQHEAPKQQSQVHSTSLRHERGSGQGPGVGTSCGERTRIGHKDNRDRERDRERQRGGRGHGAGDAGVVNNLGKQMRSKKHDVKINIISDGSQAQGRKHMLQHSGSNSNNSSRLKATQARHKLATDCMSTPNDSVPNLTASNYFSGNNNNSVLLDDSSTSNYGDGEESSVVSSMIHTPQRWPLRHKDISFSECSSTYSSSTLERDLEIIDLLERERSMDIQEMLQREQHGEKVRPTVGRQLPDIEKLYAQRSPKAKRSDCYGYDKAALALVMPGSDPLSLTLSCSSSSSSTSQPTEYSLSSAQQDQQHHHHQQQHHHHHHQQQQQQLQQQLAMEQSVVGNSTLTEVQEEEEEVPEDFYDSYTPGGSNTLPTAMQVANATAAAAAAAAAAATPVYQYQYTRRLSRKSSSVGSHHVAGVGSTRNSKRDSFNSLNGTDLIAGAFCELDPTQPLNKMTGLDGRMRRSSPRNASFGSSSARSSLKSRDYGHGSTHSAHPELDFRENIFAEL